MRSRIRFQCVSPSYSFILSPILIGYEFYTCRSVTRVYTQSENERDIDTLQNRRVIIAIYARAHKRTRLLLLLLRDLYIALRKLVLASRKNFSSSQVKSNTIIRARNAAVDAQ